MTGLTLGNLTLSGTTQNALSASHAASYLLTSSFNTYSGTTDTVIGTLQTSTSSLNSFTSSATTRLDNIETSTGSLNTFTSSTTSRLNSIEGVSGSYATTGSNQFKNDQVITGSLTVTGFIDAQELRTTYISSSILYRSGSTKFGDELSDTHAFTGSLLVSGSISVPGSNLVSSSVQVDVMSTTNIARLATTGSNTFTGIQSIGTSESPTSGGNSLRVFGSGSATNMQVFTTTNHATFFEANTNSGSIVTRLQSQNASFVGTLTNNTFDVVANGSVVIRSNGDGNVTLGTTNTGADGLSLNNGRNLSFAEGSGESYANIFRQRNTAATVIASGYKRSGTSTFASSFGTSMARSAIAVGYNNGSIAFFSDPSSNVANGTDISPSERMTILNNGNIGIGVDTPAGKLHVSGTSENSESGQIRITNSAQTFLMGYNTTSDYGYLNVYRAGLGYRPLALQPDGGRVGIGITNPGSTLHVVGSVSSEKAYNGMDDGMVLYFPFSENTGTATIDRSQIGFTGTLTNGTTWGNGILGYGVILDGTNDYISVAANTINVSFGTNMSYSMWINVSSLTSKTRQYLVDLRGDGGGSGTSSYFLFDYAGTDMVTFTVGNSGLEVISSNVGMPTGVWHHVAATRSGSTWKIYLNGVEVKSGTSNSTALTLTNTFRIGTYSGAGAGAEYYFQGSMDEVKIYKRTLSANEISLQYYEGVPELSNPTYTEIATGTITYSDAISAWAFKNSFPANLRNYVDEGVGGSYSDTYNDNYGRGIKFDLGSPKAVRRIIERGYSVSNVDTLTVQYSNDNSNWVTILTYPHIFGNTQKVMDFNQYGAIYARYWRWFISGWTPARGATNYYTYENIIFT
jgi:hypothetical protein